MRSRHLGLQALVHQLNIVRLLPSGNWQIVDCKEAPPDEMAIVPADQYESQQISQTLPCTICLDCRSNFCSRVMMQLVPSWGQFIQSYHFYLPKSFNGFMKIIKKETDLQEQLAARLAQSL